MPFRFAATTAPTPNPFHFGPSLADLMHGDAADVGLRSVWLARCESKLQELRPWQDRDAIAALAADMWPDVRRFSPEIAAEMEHESSWMEQ
ncbi:hypothetical protein BH11PSE8_BH11PSE8_27130 [soil metagenome]